MATEAEIIASGDLVLPFKSNPRYFYNIELDGEVYKFSFHWNEVDTAWYLDIEGITNDVEYNGIKLVTGPNLLKPYAILELGGLYIVDGENRDSDPDFDNAGIRYFLYYVPVGSDAII